MGLKAAELLAMYSVDEGPLEKSLGSIPGKVAKMAGIIGGGLAIGDALSQSLDQDRLNDKLAAQLGATGKTSAELGKVAGSLYANAYGDSLDQVNEAIKNVVQNIGDTGPASDSLQKVSGKVLNLASAFDVDLGGATAAVGQLMRTGLADNADQALDIVTAGFQAGDDKAGDFLDTLNEYGGQFQKLGINGATATGLISQGLQAGARSGDLVGDAIKEFSIRAVDGSTTTAQGFQMIGLNAGKMAEQIGQGGKGASDGLQTVLDKLRGIQDPVKRSQAAVALFGTQAEDLGSALFALDPAHAVDALGKVGGAADRMGKTLNDNASTNLETFKRGLMQGVVNVLGTYVVPVITTASGVITGLLGPAFSWIGGVLSNDVAPVLKAVFGFFAEHQTTTKVLAGLIAGLLVPALVLWGTAATVNAAKNVVAWVTTAFSAQTGAAAQEKSAAQVALSWLAMGLQAVAQGIKIAAVWTAQIVASAVTGAASFVIQVVRVVAGWVLMGAQSLLQAARMAAAWVIAMGPVGWVIAAVVGLVALIIANWDTVVSWTKTAWSAVTGAVSAAWEWIKGAVAAALDFVVNLFLNFTGPGLIIKHWQSIVDFTQAAWNAVVGAIQAAWNWITGIISSAVGAVAGAMQAAWNWVTSTASAAWNGLVGIVQSAAGNVLSFVGSLPGRILGALGNLGSLLLSAGRDLLTGLWNGISGAADWLWGKVKSFFGSLLPGWVKDMLGIHSPSTVFAELGKHTMAGFGVGIDDGTSGAVKAAERAAAAVTAAMQVRAPAALVNASGAQLAAAGNASAQAAVAGGIDAIVKIGEYHAAPSDDPNATAQKLAVLARTGGAG